MNTVIISYHIGIYNIEEEIPDLIPILMVDEDILPLDIKEAIKLELKSLTEEAGKEESIKTISNNYINYE